MKMDNDIEQSVRKWFERILDSPLQVCLSTPFYLVVSSLYHRSRKTTLQVMLYNGDLDIICGVPLTEAMLQTFEWSDSAQYRVAPKLHWRVDPSDKEIAGYVRHVRNFYQVECPSFLDHKFFAQSLLSSMPWESLSIVYNVCSTQSTVYLFAGSCEECGSHGANWSAACRVWLNYAFCFP